MSEEEMTPRPTIDVDSPRIRRTRQPIVKYNRKTSYIVNKFRKRQMILMDTNDIEDPDPYVPTYIFYCFTGTLED